MQAQIPPLARPINACRMFVLWTFLLGATAVKASAGPILYEVIPVAGPNSNAFAINSNGDITGVFRTSGGADHAFLFSQANGFLDLGTLSGGNSLGRDLDDSGAVVGQSDGRAFKYTQTTGMVGLDVGSSDARSINNLTGDSFGTVYGSSSTSTIWSNINTPSSVFVTENTEGYGINNFGQIVGRVDGTTGYYSDGTSSVSYTDLGLFLPNSINNQGMVAGSENGIAGYYDSVSQTYLSFGFLNISSDTVSEAFGLNDLNQFVGFSGDGVTSRGFLWDQTNGFVDLTANLEPGFEQWTVLSANGINDDGFIPCQVSYQGYEYAAYLKPTVVPEASSLVLVSLGPIAFGMLAFISSRRSRRYSRQSYQMRGGS